MSIDIEDLHHVWVALDEVRDELRQLRMSCVRAKNAEDATRYHTDAGLRNMAEQVGNLAGAISALAARIGQDDIAKEAQQMLSITLSWLARLSQSGVGGGQMGVRIGQVHGDVSGQVAGGNITINDVARELDDLGLPLMTRQEMAQQLGALQAELEKDEPDQTVLDQVLTTAERLVPALVPLLTALIRGGR